jgi:hypothetical protein
MSTWEIVLSFVVQYLGTIVYGLIQTLSQVDNLWLVEWRTGWPGLGLLHRLDGILHGFRFDR